MALKKKVVRQNTVSKKEKLKNEIKSVEQEIRELKEKQLSLEKELLELEIQPFKIGGYALVEVPCGKSKKEQKCLLEQEHGVLYVRPIKDNGELSGRHFSICPIGHNYSEYLKEVK